MRPHFRLPILILPLLFLLSCENGPGEGGQASIKGRLLVEDYNGNCTVLLDTFYGIDIPVYIIAGDDPSYFERVRTGPDGVFWFPYLRPGKYTVYAISEPCPPPRDETAVEVEVTIDGRKEQVEIGDIVIQL